MGQIAFDTHAFVKRLTDVGMPEPQAAVLAGEQARLIESDIATKHDIEELRAATARDIAEVKHEIEALRAETARDIAEVKRDIAELRTEVRRDMKDLEQRLTIRLGGMMMAAVAILSALVKLL